jgi:hypothetical protein
MYLDGIFDLVNSIKRRFRKKPIEQELDEYLDSEMPGELDTIAKYSRGIHTDEQFEKLRKDL